MHKIKAIIEIDGEKKAIYQLKEDLLRLASQYNSQCHFDITDSIGFQEMISATFQPIIDVSAEDIVDLTLTGEDQFELLVRQEEESK